jgi:hypothetical protein
VPVTDALASDTIKEIFMEFNMSVEDNFASFTDDATGVKVFVDSFDNGEFDVRIGTVTESSEAGTITAKTSEELNEKLKTLYEKHQSVVVQ